MIRVAIGISMERNPGRSVAAACVMSRAHPHLHVRRVGEMTNQCAYWHALGLAAERLAGREATIFTNCTGLMRAPAATAYDGIALTAWRAVTAAGGKVVHVRTEAGEGADGPEAAWVRWCSRLARAEMLRWAAESDERYADAAALADSGIAGGVAW